MEGKKLTKVKRWIKEHKAELEGAALVTVVAGISFLFGCQKGHKDEYNDTEHYLRNAIDTNWMILTTPEKYGEPMNRVEWCNEIDKRFKK